MLTKKQHELLRFIHERLKEQGVPPSFDEMKDALDLRSKSGIHRLIMALEERGFIRRLPNRARALEVVSCRNPAAGLAPMPRAARFPPERHRRQPRARPPRSGGRGGRRGRSSCRDGTHRRRDADRGDPAQATRSSFRRNAFGGRAFRARGQGRFDDRGRHLRRRHGDDPAGPGADTGDIVVALIDDEEATLKRFRRKGASIALEAANPAYETRIFRTRPGAGPGQARRALPALLIVRIFSRFVRKLRWQGSGCRRGGRGRRYPRSGNSVWPCGSQGP